MTIWRSANNYRISITVCYKKRYLKNVIIRLCFVCQFWFVLCQILQFIKAKKTVFVKGVSDPVGQITVRNTPFWIFFSYSRGLRKILMLTHNLLFGFVRQGRIVIETAGVGIGRVAHSCSQRGLGIQPSTATRIATRQERCVYEMVLFTPTKVLRLK